VPAAPQFGIAVSSSKGGVLDLSAVSFNDFSNTRTIVAGTYAFYFYDELITNGLVPVALSASIAVADTVVRFAAAIAPATFVQIDGEIVLATATDLAGNTTVQRGLLGTQAAAHDVSALAYPLTEKVAIVPFVKNFFGSPSSGDWRYSLELPNVRLASASLFMTNALGPGAVTSISFTGLTNDQGLRTLSGGQFSFQISGYLAIQTVNATPAVIVDADHSIRDIYGVLGTGSGGAGVTLQVNLNGALYATVQFDEGATTSNTVPGFGLPILHAGDLLTLEVTGVGTTNPGSDLTLVVRL
jgi:hypothetical protein